MSQRVANTFIAVGDIHGDSERLKKMLTKVSRREEQIIFLGDYVNRGPDTKGVIELLIEFRKNRPDTCFLLGNHDYLFLRYLAEGDFRAFAKLGGLATMRSYIPGHVNRDVRRHLSEALPPDHKQFLLNLVSFWENADFLASHAGFDPRYPERRNLESMVLSDHTALFAMGDVAPKTAVFGHYVQKDRKPFLSSRVICLDTGCGFPAGTLSAMLFPQRILFVA